VRVFSRLKNVEDMTVNLLVHDLHWDELPDEESNSKSRSKPTGSGAGVGASGSASVSGAVPAASLRDFSNRASAAFVSAPAISPTRG
jgi:hypothetical protein